LLIDKKRTDHVASRQIKTSIKEKSHETINTYTHGNV